MPVLSWIQIGAGAIGAFALSFLLHIVDVHRIEANWQAKLDQQKIELENQCKADQTITKEANDDLQKKYDSIAGKLAASKRMHPARCIIPAPSKTIASSGGNGHAGQNGTGLSTDWLRDYAAECETYRSQRISLEKFIDDVWAARNQ